MQHASFTPEKAAVANGTATRAVKARSALVLYGSETGNGQDVAEEVGRLAERLRFNTVVIDLDSCQIRDLLKATVVIFVVSTTGQGEMPQNARLFWKALLSDGLKPGILRKATFTSFGLGDSSYPKYNIAHRMLCRRMVQLGAKEFCERGEGNEQHPEGHSAGFREWIVLLQRQLTEDYPLPDGVEAIPGDQFVEPKWRLAVDDDRVPTPRATSIDDLPSADVLPIKGAYVADIHSNERVTAPEHFQDTRLLDLRVDEPLDYPPGAVAVIYPKNFPHDVQDFIDLMHWEDVADTPLKLQKTSESVTAPSPLRHLDPSQTTLTLRWLLENVLDIMSIPRRMFFATLLFFAASSTEDEQFQKDRLVELANPELIDELWDYTTRPKRTILEVMMDFTTVRIPWQYALTGLPQMKGRQFSIASGGSLRTTPEGQTRLQLLVAIAKPPSPIIKYRRRHGVCTRYIAQLRAPSQLAVTVQQGYLGTSPDHIQQPAILIGPGTGLAPLRALLHARLQWSAAHAVQQGRQPSTDSDGDGKALVSDLLIQGMRSSATDYYFRRELEELSSQHGVRLRPAFSRPQSEAEGKRQYVQQVLVSERDFVADALLRRGGRVYVCGSSGAMPKAVREAVVEVLMRGVDDALGMSEREAELYLERMEEEGRYVQETW